MKPGVDHIGIVALIWIYRDQEFLFNLAGRGTRDDTEAWRIFGGVVERGETLESAARREAHEESGIAYEHMLETAYLGHDEAFYANGQHWLRFHYVIRVSADARPEILEPGKTEELRWMPLDEFKSLPNLHSQIPDILSKYEAPIRALLRSL
jgi:8-oxo-dGTP diphosphatase